MNGQVIATIVIQVLGLAFYYGIQYATVRDHGRAIEDLKDSDQKQWDQISLSRENIGKIKGRLDMNGAT